MLMILHPAAVARGSVWRPGAAYTIVRGDAEIGRIDVNGAPERDGAGRIALREQSFECRIHRTGRKRWTHVPARWVMYSGDTALHGATCESNTSFLTEDEADQKPMRLRRHFSGPSTLERAADQQRVGEIREVRARLLPKPRALRIVSDITADLAETFELLLLWIAYRTSTTGIRDRDN